MRIRLGLGIAAALSFFTLGACDPASNADNTDETSSSAGSPDDSSGEEPTEATGLTDGRSGSGVRLTNPGTTLAIGDPASVPVAIGDDGAGTVQITVSDIEMGETQDLLEAEVEDGADYTPYYIQAEVKIRAEAGDGLGGLSVNTNLDGLIGTTTAGRLVTFGDFGPCASKSAGPGAKVGDTFETCVVALAPTGDAVDGVQFSAYDSAYDTFDGKPVIWRR